MDSSSTAVSRPLNRPRLALGIAGAAVVNLVVYAVASGVGATWIANGQTVTAILVVAATVISMVVGAVITWFLSRRWARAAATMAVVGVAFAIVTAPAGLVASSDSPTKWALASMHVVTGLSWFLAVYPFRSDRAA